jgi:hypothetical protein
MSEKNVISAVTYYKAMGDKNLAALDNFLHPDVRFLGPLADITGKNAYLESLTKFFFPSFTKLIIRAQFGSGDQAMIVFDLDCPAPVGILRTAVLITFKDGLISRLEAFFDPRPVIGSK